jgi:hypothetical protein
MPARCAPIIFGPALDAILRLHVGDVGIEVEKLRLRLGRASLRLALLLRCLARFPLAVGADRHAHARDDQRDDRHDTRRERERDHLRPSGER